MFDIYSANSSREEFASPDQADPYKIVFGPSREAEPETDVTATVRRPARPIVSTLLLLLAAGPRESRACSVVCVVGRDVPDREWTAALHGALDSRPIVFLGRVTKVAPETSEPELPPEYANRVATLEVIREWKGTGQSTYRMTTACCSASCGYPFEVGQVHLLFISRDGEWMSSSGCPDPTKDDIRKTIRKLDRLAHRKALVLPPELR